MSSRKAFIPPIRLGRICRGKRSVLRPCHNVDQLATPIQARGLARFVKKLKSQEIET